MWTQQLKGEKEKIEPINKLEEQIYESLMYREFQTLHWRKTTSLFECMLYFLITYMCWSSFLD